MVRRFVADGSAHSKKATLDDTDSRYRESVLPVMADRLAGVVGLVTDVDDRDYVCFEGDDGWCVGVGRAAELVADRRRVVLKGRHGRVELPWDRGSIGAVPALLASAGLAGWRAYGWCGFDLAAAKEGRLDLVDDRPFLHFIIPEVEVRLSPAGTLLRALRASDLEWAQALLMARATHGHEGPVTAAAPDMLDQLDASRHDYEVAVDKALHAIHLGRVQKVVLARKIPVPADVDLIGTYEAGRRRTTPARSFLFALGGLEAAGLSPESVVRVGDDGTVTSQLLAGTRPAAGYPAGDAAVREELLRDPKEVFEHAVSVRAALDEIGTVCDPASVVVEGLLSVKNCGSLQHLASTVRGRMADGCTAWDVFTALFPAVTLTGTPKLAACELIRELEKEGRAAYGGAVVTFGASGTLDTAAVLRAVFRSDGQAWIQAGAGIVAQSRPDREFTETREKALAIGRHLVPRRREGNPS